MMSFQNFLASNWLIIYQFMRGLNTGRRQVEMIARVFAAMELKLDIIRSKPNESQSNLLQSNYEKNWRNSEFLILKQGEKMQMTMLQNGYKLH